VILRDGVVRISSRQPPHRPTETQATT